MYPTVVLVMVGTQRSITDVCEISPSIDDRLAGPVASEARPATLGHLSFAVGPVHTTRNNEAESQRSHALWSQGGQEQLEGVEEVILEVNESQVGTSG